VWRLVKTTARLLHLWWSADRIRISPREGRLLRLPLPCLLRIRGELIEVTARRVVHSAAARHLVYRCTSAGAAYELTVTSRSLGRQVVIRRGAAEEVVADEDIEIIIGCRSCVPRRVRPC
jgi:hypothetical protein